MELFLGFIVIYNKSYIKYKQIRKGMVIIKMKRRLAVLLVIMMCLTSFSAFALEDSNVASGVDTTSTKSEQEIEDLVKIVKAQINIPENYSKFETGMSNYDGKTIWNLSWSTDNDEYMTDGDGNIHVSIDSEGVIISFNHYKYNREYDYQKKIPEITRAQAFKNAQDFVNRIGADIVNELNFEDGSKNINISYEGSYNLNFYRQVNGIPFYENNVSVTVDGETGEIRGYYRNWRDDVTFAAPDNVIDISEAQKSYGEKIGLVLKYMKEYEDKETKTYLEYSPENIDRNATIDAFTGEKVISDAYYDIYYAAGGGAEMMSTGANMKQMRAPAMDMVELSPEEIKETEKIKGLITVEEAEKIARSIKEFGIDEDFELRHYNLSRYTQTKEDRYRLYLSFIKPIKDMPEGISQEKINLMIASGEFVENANVTIDAKTGEIISFSSYNRNEQKEENKYELDELRKMAEEFLKKYKSDKFKQTKLLDFSDKVEPYIGMPYPETDGVTYIRMVEGIPFEDNKLAVYFNKATGKIRSFSESWDDIEFVSPDNVIGDERAHEVFFNEVGLELRYISVPKSEGIKPEDIRNGSIGRESRNVKLVYAPTYGKPVCIDAISGIVINNYSSEPYKEETVDSFNDIDGHFAQEAILALAEIEVLEYEEYFRPDDVITQKELLAIVSKIRGDYYIPIRSGANVTQAEVDRMYRALKNADIIDPEEENPDEEIIREDAVKYLLRAASYRKFAELDQTCLIAISRIKMK